MRTIRQVMFVATFVGTLPTIGFAVTVDFESIASGTPLTDQYLADSVLGTPGESSGIIYSKGTNGVPDAFPSSGTQVMYLGDGFPHMRLDFVDPSNPDPFDPLAEVPARRIRFTIGNITDSAYRFEWIFGAENNEFLHMGQFDATTLSVFDSDVVLGPFAGTPFTALDLDAFMSGIIIDDIIVDFVPEPATGSLLFACFLSIAGWLAGRKETRSSPNSFARFWKTTALTSSRSRRDRRT